MHFKHVLDKRKVGNTKGKGKEKEQKNKTEGQAAEEERKVTVL